MSLLRHTAWNATAAIANAAGKILVTAILAHRLGPLSFGTFVFAQWLIEVSFTLCSFGLGGIATRFFPQTILENALAFPGFDAWFARAMTAVVMVAAVSATVAFGIFGSSPGRALIVAAGLWAVGASLWMLASARAQGRAEFKLLAICYVVNTGVTLIGLAAPQSRGSLEWVMLTMAGAQLSSFVVCIAASTYVNVRDRKARLSADHARQIREYGGNVWVTSLFSFLVATRGETPLIKGLLGDAALGFYSSGITLTGLVNQSVALLTGGLNPTIAQMWDRQQRDELMRFSMSVTRILAVVAGLCVGFVICFSHQIVHVAFGPAFAESSSLIAILALGALSLMASSPNLIIQFATNARFSRNANIIAAGVLYVLVLLMVPRFGLAGAAAARTTVQLGLAALTFAWLKRVFKGAARAGHHFLLMGILVALGAGMAIFRLARPEASLPILIAAYALYAIVLVASLALTSRDSLLHDVRFVVYFRGVTPDQPVPADVQ